MDAASTTRSDAMEGVPILRDLSPLSSLSDCTESEKECGFGCGVFLDGETREEF